LICLTVLFSRKREWLGRRRWKRVRESARKRGSKDHFFGGGGRDSSVMFRGAIPRKRDKIVGGGGGGKKGGGRQLRLTGKECAF